MIKMIFSKITNNELHLIGPLAPFLFSLSSLESTYPSNLIAVKFALKIPPKAHSISNLLNIFDWKIWMSLVMSILSVAFVFVWLDRYLPEREQV